jgi:hypothetical protein
MKRWYPNELTARNGAVLTTRYIAETHYDELLARFEVTCSAAEERCYKQADCIAKLEAALLKIIAEPLRDTAASDSRVLTTVICIAREALAQQPTGDYTDSIDVPQTETK